MATYDDLLFKVSRSAFASVRVCLFCKHYEIYRYTGGHRGAGMVGGNKARGRIIQHVKTAHPEEHAVALQKLRAQRRRSGDLSHTRTGARPC